jgi:sec-independent protein translocase protein TatA
MFSGLGYTEMILIGVIALMLFGSRLPDMARNFGATYRQLRGKVDEFQREFREWERMETPPPRPKYDVDESERVEPRTPKFVPPPPDDPADDKGEADGPADNKGE